MTYNSEGAVNNSEKSRGVPWGVVVLLLIFFFPIGIYSMVHKLHVDKENYAANGRRTATVGWVFAGIGLLYLFFGLTGTLEFEDGSSAMPAAVMMLLIFGGIGFSLIRHGNKYKKTGLLYLRYTAILKNGFDGSIDNIASVTGKTYEAVCADLQNMIDNAILQDAYIDPNKRALVAPFIGASKAAQAAMPYAAQWQTEAAAKVIKCPSCGAVNRVENIGEVCEFCGSPLGN